MAAQMALGAQGVALLSDFIVAVMKEGALKAKIEYQYQQSKARQWLTRKKHDKYVKKREKANKKPFKLNIDVDTASLHLQDREPTLDEAENDTDDTFVPRLSTATKVLGCVDTLLITVSPNPCTTTTSSISAGRVGHSMLRSTHPRSRRRVLSCSETRSRASPTCRRWLGLYLPRIARFATGSHAQTAIFCSFHPQPQICRYVSVGE